MVVLHRWLKMSAIKKFNNRVQALNAGGRELTLGARDARDLQAEIFELLAQIAELTSQLQKAQGTPSQIAVDAGKF